VVAVDPVLDPVTVDTVVEADTRAVDTVVDAGTEEKEPDPDRANLFFRLRLPTPRTTNRGETGVLRTQHLLLLLRVLLRRTTLVDVARADLATLACRFASIATSRGIFAPNALY